MPVCAASANAATPNSSGGKRWPPNYAAAPPGAPAPSRPCWRCTTSTPHPSPPEKQHPTGRSPTKPDTQTPAARDHPGRLRGAHQARPPPPAVTMPRPTRDQSGMIEPNPGSPTYFESDHAHDLQVSQCCISVKSPTDQPEQQDGTSSMATPPTRSLTQSPPTKPGAWAVTATSTWTPPSMPTAASKHPPTRM